VAGDVFRRGVGLLERRQFVQIDVVQSVKRLSNRLLHLSKINADSDLIELPALDGDPDGPVVSMEVLAISRIIP